MSKVKKQIGDRVMITAGQHYVEMDVMLSNDPSDYTIEILQSYSKVHARCLDNRTRRFRLATVIKCCHNNDIQ